MNTSQRLSDADLVALLADPTGWNRFDMDRVVLDLQDARACLAKTERDTERLDWLETQGELVLDFVDEEGSRDREVVQVHGPVNDREWRSIGRGRTYRDAIDSAIAHPVRSAGGATA